MMKKALIKRSLLCCLLLSFCVMFASAQQRRTITGTVKDDQGEPIPLVSYKIKGTTKGGATTESGTFSIAVESTDKVIVFSSIGFTTQEVTIGTSNTLNVVLQSDSKALGEVVVTALGINKNERKLGYAVTTVKGAELTRTNTVSPISALQGKVAGVNINTMSGSGVQQSPNIIIRGTTSPNPSRNQPIFVVDGMVLQNNIVGSYDADNGSQMKNLNPDDYESVTVLKGAAATSLYGSRGANGAVVITTKKGKLNSGLGIEFNSTYQTQDIYRNGIALQDVYGMGSWATREGNFRPDGTHTTTGYSFGPKMDGSLHPALYDATKLVPYSSQSDNWKAFMQDPRYLNNNLALSGGGEKFAYRFSYSNLDNKGALPNNGLKRNSFDFKTNGQLNKVFSVDAGVSYAVSNTTNPQNQSRDFYSSGQNLGFLTYYEVPRNADIQEWKANSKNPDGSRKDYGNAGFNRMNGQFNRMDYLDNNRKENSLLANFLLKAQVNDWFDVSGKANLNYYKIFTEAKEQGSDAFGAGGSYALSGNYNSSYNFLLMAHANRKALNNDLDIDVRLLNEYYGNGIKESYGASTNGGLIVPNVFTLSNSVNAINNNRSYSYGTPDEKVIAVGGIVNLNYKDYLNLELTARNDWQSSLIYPEGVPGKNNYSVFYPSANLSWSFSDMLKEKMPQWLSFGKLRASLAWAGSGTSAYQTSFGAYNQSSFLDYNGNSITAATLQNANILPNLNLKPEIKRSLEFGTNLGLFDDKVNVDLAWYRTNTFNQIITIPSIPETGYNSMLINAGDIQNQGLELLVNFNPIRTKDVKWDLSFNYTRNRSKVNKFYGDIVERELLDTYAGSGVGVYAYTGGAFGVLATRGSVREYDQSTGLPLVRIPRDANGNALRVSDSNPDSKYDFADYEWVQKQYATTTERHVLGKIEPDFLAGFNTTLRYKQFSFFTQLDSRFGGVVYSEAYNYGMMRGNLKNSLQYRDQEHGGVERIDSYNGQVRYDGAIPDAVFAAGETSPLKPGVNIGGMTFQDAYNQGLVEPWKAGYYYVSTYGWQTNFDNGSVSKNSWIMLREISLGYQLPSSFTDKIKLKGASLRVSARNIGYLYKTLKGDQNPESIQSNNPFMPIITGVAPYSRNYSLTLNIAL